MKDKCFQVMLCTVLFLYIPVLSKAQDSFVELGLNLGGGFYLGDLNQTIPFHNTHPAYGVSAAYNIDYRFSTRFTAQYTTVSGAQDQFTDRLPIGDYSFSNKVSDYNIRLEFNFFHYTFNEMQPGDSHMTPYIFAGIGYVGFGDDNRSSFGFPFGVGYKYKLTERLNVGAEWKFMSLSRDDLDNLSDPYKIGATSFMNRDWLSVFAVFITLDLFKNEYKCIMR